jgi:NADH:ubiquinone oxidoreductase subunit C
MTIENVLQAAEALLKPWAQSVNRPSVERLDVALLPEDLTKAVGALVKDKTRYLSAITGLDRPAADAQPAEGRIEALYHFGDGAAVITLRVTVPYSGAVPTLCGLIPSATLYERELMEMFGITVTGTPDTDKLLLPEDWPAGVYPLRKSFQGLGSATLVK